MRPHFFLSYARVDDQDVYVRRFYKDLCRALVELAEPDQEIPTGFLDNAALRIGHEWPEHLAEALATCRTMVALYSPGYFRSVWCSREAGVVMARATLYHKRTRLSSSALIPVLWDPVRVPDEVSHIQYLSDDLGAWYRDAGLRRLLQQDPTGPDYLNAVRVIAGRVAEVAGREDLPVVEPTSLKDAPRSFEPRVKPVGRGASVRFYVAAGAAATVPEPRRVMPYYGPDPLDWNPYHPQEEYPLYQQAQRIVTEKGFGTTYSELGTGLARQLEQSWEKDQVSILLVDAWSADQQPFRRELERFDRAEHPAVGVLVPCHPASERDQEDLWLGVTRIFERKSCRPTNEQFRLRVYYGEFKKALERMVTAAQNNLMRKRSIARPPGPDSGTTAPGRPFLKGPGSAPGPDRSAPDKEEEPDGGDNP